MRREISLDVHRATRRRLDSAQTQHALSCGDVDAGAAGGDDRARWRRGRRGRDGRRFEDAQAPAVAQLRFGDGPRVERAHAPFEREGWLAPVEQRFGFRDLRGDGRERALLRHGDGGARQYRRQRGEQCLRRESGEPFVQRTGRFLRADRRRPLEVHGPRVEPGIHLHDADAGHGVAGQHGALDRRRAAPTRQQRRVQVDAAEPRPLEQRPRE